MLCGGVLGDLGGKGKTRDDETKEAAVQCLHVLLRPRRAAEENNRIINPSDRLKVFQELACSPKFTPILGQTMNSLLVVSDSRRLSLQVKILQVVELLIDLYFPEDLLPSVFPGIISTICRLILGTKSSSWANSQLVIQGLKAMQSAVERTIGDSVCLRAGAIKVAVDLEDLASITSEPAAAQSETSSDNAHPFATRRTSSWLQGTSSQLHIALNSLTPLSKHPTPDVLLALSTFSQFVLISTPSTLPQSQTLLLSFLLLASISEFPSVAAAASNSLISLLGQESMAQVRFVQTIIRVAKSSLTSLSTLVQSRAEAKIEHVAGLVTAVCRLSIQHVNLRPISEEIGGILGPSSGIERWGWSLLSVLEFCDPPMVVSQASPSFLIEASPQQSLTSPFPELTLQNISLRSTYTAIESMFRALGAAACDACLPSVEWFVGVGQGSVTPRSVAALWCAQHLLEGAAGLDISSPRESSKLSSRSSKRLEAFARELTKSLARIWDEQGSLPDIIEPPAADDDLALEIIHRKGVAELHEMLKITHSGSKSHQKSTSQLVLHRALCLRVMAVTSGILKERFSPLLLYALYPVLHSSVSPVAHLSATAMSALKYITFVTSYAAPSNLVMSNFDYALDSVSRRLTRRWLDISATKVLIVVIRVIGHDIVERAGDVVEECFDRLDEFHGYAVLVDGLIEVLSEIVKVIKTEDEAEHVEQPPVFSTRQEQDRKEYQSFFLWLRERKICVEAINEEVLDYGPAPHRAWGPEKAPEEHEPNLDDDTVSMEPPTPTPLQALTAQIVTRSIYFLTHGSGPIRARILTMLTSAIPVLPESALMPAIHSTWPFILNRLDDPEYFVVSAAAALVEALVRYRGTYMFQRVWHDVWPFFHKKLKALDTADGANALARRGHGVLGTESAYTHSHRLYRSIVTTMTAAMNGVDPHDNAVWQLITSFRRFLHSKAHPELQELGQGLYVAIGRNNSDAVWLGLQGTVECLGAQVKHLYEPKWDLVANVDAILAKLG